MAKNIDKKNVFLYPNTNRNQEFKMRNVHKDGVNDEKL